MPPQPDKQVILIGIGGASCSGKTTLAKHLRNILPNSVIVHQDDFAPPQHEIPIHPLHGVQDWDNAQSAIDWPRLASFLRQVKATGVIPNDHRSHDHLNEQKEIPISGLCRQKWISEFGALGKEVSWVIVDGFLLYWDTEVVEQLDTRILLRVPYDVLKQRRHERHGYHTAEGSLWRDPPDYFDHIVYPAYVDAHRDMLEGGDVERGKPSGKVDGLILLDMLTMAMDEAVDRCCTALTEAIKDIELS
ncbi:hypothetical protein APHAL10511_000151 [Amanita phalloides]|nr:hypothetical protein APHAL10511_000151 [Amanita phalloides]